MLNEIKTHSDERTFITGQTGSGKTFLARELLRNVTRLIVIDTKGELTNWNTENYDVWVEDAIKRGERVRARVIPPIADDLEEYYEDIFKLAYSAGGIVVYVDEVYAVIPPGSKPGKWFTALYTQGRTREVGVVACSQRPTWIPIFCMSEAQHYFVFRLNFPDDRDRIAKTAGMTELTRPIYDPHGFYYYKSGVREVQYVERIHPQQRKEVVNENQARRLQTSSLSA